MMETYGLEKLGIANPKAVYRNLTPAQLTEAALARGEGKLSNKGALVVTTGKYTGRSPKDKFIVDTPAVHDDIAWGSVNVPIEKAKFDAIKAKVDRIPSEQRDLLIRRYGRRRSGLHQKVPYRQRAGKPESVHPRPADPSDSRRACQLRRA